MEFLIVLAVLVIVVLIVIGPLRRPRLAGEENAQHLAEVEVEVEREREIAELEAEREAKYREIRDAELDHRTGKLSDADFEAVDRGLRVEAFAILRALDRARGERSKGSRYHRCR